MSEETPSPERVESKSLKAILGQKVGMTQIFDTQGQVIPVTVIEAGPCHVTQVRTVEKNGYSAIQVAFGAVREKSLNKPDAGQFKKANVPIARWLREFRTEQAGSFQPGHVIKADVFSAGDYVDVIGVSKGKGFAGAVKRHGFRGGPRTHGQSDRLRAPGSSGSNTFPGRVFKGKKFPGHLGDAQATVQHLEVVHVVADQNLLMVRGAIPGPNQALVSIQQTVKRLKVKVHHAVPEAAKKEKAAKKEAPKATPAAKPKPAK